MHTLKADVLVEPDTPADLIFFVNRELFSEQVVPLFIDLVMVCLVRTGVNWAKLSVPDL
jgi:hypothetical protein